MKRFIVTESDLERIYEQAKAGMTFEAILGTIADLHAVKITPKGRAWRYTERPWQRWPNGRK